MAKFGLFSANSQGPVQTYEGDVMDQQKEYVYIYKYEATVADSSVRKRRQVAAINLAPGQSVKEIE
jgi:hypothetical protein